MFWWFKRKDDLLRYEARQLPSGDFESASSTNMGTSASRRSRTPTRCTPASWNSRNRSRKTVGPDRTGGIYSLIVPVSSSPFNRNSLALAAAILCSTGVFLARGRAFWPFENFVRTSRGLGRDGAAMLPIHQDAETWTPDSAGTPNGHLQDHSTSAREPGHRPFPEPADACRAHRARRFSAAGGVDRRGVDAWIAVDPQSRGLRAAAEGPELRSRRRRHRGTSSCGTGSSGCCGGGVRCNRRNWPTRHSIGWPASWKTARRSLTGLLERMCGAWHAWCSTNRPANPRLLV